MNSENKKYVLLVLASVVISAVILFPTFAPLLGVSEKDMPSWMPSKKIKLGLDLRGGVYLALGVQSKEAVKSQLNSIAGNIRAELKKERIGILKAKSLNERELQLLFIADKGATETDEYVRKNFPELTLSGSKVEDGHLMLTYRMSEIKAKEVEHQAVDQAIETIRNRIDQFGVAEPHIQKVGENQIIVQLPDVTDIESVKKTIGSVAKLEFRLVADPKKTGETKTFKTRDGGSVQLEDEVLMTGDVVQAASIDMDMRTSQVSVGLQLSSVGAQIFDRITSENVGRLLAIVLDGVVQSSPNIRERISGGRAEISGGFTTEEARRLAIVLRSGALPAPLTFDSERLIGATLGADSIKSGLYASLIGALFVIVFMIVYYGRCGALAIGCLAINIIWLMALLALFGATLTLPGIAGLALTVGMAVDSNIIVFERIREELRHGNGVLAAIEAGFSRGRWTVLDANITTLLSGLILYSFGSGPIKGYAVSLSIGIVTTVIAMLHVSKLGFAVCNLVKRDGTLSIGMKQKSKNA